MPILFEGGNVFKDETGTPLTQRINRADVAPTVQWLEGITGLSLRDNMLGSTGIKDTSGDLDLAVDSNHITKDAVVEQLIKYCRAIGIDPTKAIRKSGIGVHFLTPIGGDANKGYVQTDFMFLKDVSFSKFVLGAMPSESRYKGVDRNILINSIAKSMGAKLDQTRGIVDRESNDLISNDINQIAKILLNPSAHGKDLASVENIMAALRNDPKRKEKVADAFADYQRRGIQLPESAGEPTQSQWFRRFSDMVQ